MIPAELEEHFTAAAALHTQGITEGFLSTLGEPFLDVLYRGIAAADGSGVFVAVRSDEVLGFISYAEDVRNCYRRVALSQWGRLALALAPSLVRPQVVRRVFETLAYPFRSRQGGEQSSTQALLRTGPRRELLSMAVGEGARGLGVGKLLITRLDQEMVRRGLDGYFVVTHATDERSNGFYMGCGFGLVRAFQNHGKPMHEYYKDLSDSSS